MEANIALWAAVYAACFLPQRSLRGGRRAWIANLLLLVAGVLTAAFPLLFVMTWALIELQNAGSGGGLIIMMFAIPVWAVLVIGFAFAAFKALKKPEPEPVHDPQWVRPSDG